MSHMSNLAFLCVLAGGVLPGGFERIADHIGSVVGGDLDDCQGTGIENEAQDDFDYDAQDGYQDCAQQDGFQDCAQQDYAQQDDCQDYAQQDGHQDFSVPENGVCPPDYTEGVVVPGVPVPDGGAPDVVQGFVVPDTAVPDAGFGNMGGYDNEDGVGEDGADLDCGCIEDILGSLLETDGF